MINAVETYDCFCKKEFLTGSGFSRLWIRDHVFSKKRRISNQNGLWLSAAALSNNSPENSAKTSCNPQSSLKFCKIIITMSRKFGPAHLRNRVKRWIRCAAQKAGVLEKHCLCRKFNPTRHPAAEQLNCKCACLVVMFDQKLFKNLNFTLVSEAFSKIDQKNRF